MKPTKPNKILAVALAGILLSGCASKPDEVAQKMIDDINAIGTVEVSDEEAIEKAEKLYANLTEKQKEQVSNYAVLLQARETLDILLEEKAKKDAEELKTTYINNLNSINDTMLLGALNAEECGNLIYKVWYNTIYEKDNPTTNKYTKYKNFDIFNSDFNVSLRNLFADEDYQAMLQKVRDSQDTAMSLMKDMKNYPEELSDSYTDLKEYYDAFIELTNIVISPSGSLQTFSSNFNDADSRFSDCYKKMKVYLE